MRHWPIPLHWPTSLHWPTPLHGIALLALAGAAPLSAQTERPTNAEMTAIFTADQAARADIAHVDTARLIAEDEARRTRTQALLDAGQLQSGQDYLNAAFVFQHGQRPADYLKAHLLAMIAVARGKPEATWIASATLDRYLQAIGQPQVLGTQFRAQEDKSMTQEPYARDLVSDAMRQALGVPSQADQVAQARRFEAQLRGK